MKEQLNVWFDGLVSWIANTGVNVGLKIVIALIVWFISFRIINAIGRKIEKKGDLPKYDKTITKTLAYIFKLAFKSVVLVALIGFLGIDTSAITALAITEKIATSNRRMIRVFSPVSSAYTVPG